MAWGQTWRTWRSESAGFPRKPGPFWRPGSFVCLLLGCPVAKRTEWPTLSSPPPSLWAQVDLGKNKGFLSSSKNFRSFVHFCNFSKASRAKLMIHPKTNFPCAEKSTILPLKWKFGNKEWVSVDELGQRGKKTAQ